MNNTGLILYQEDYILKSFFINFFDRINCHKVLEILPNCNLNIEKIFLETGLGDSYKSYERKDLGMLKSVEDLKSTINSMGEDIFIYELNFVLEDGVSFHVSEDFNIEIKSINDIEHLIEKILSLLPIENSSIKNIVREAKLHAGSYIEVDFDGEIKKYHKSFDSYLLSQKDSGKS